MKRIGRLFFLGFLSITLALIFVAGCSSKNDVKYKPGQSEKGSYGHHRNKFSGKFA
jgi:hypothetical protein